MRLVVPLETSVAAAHRKPDFAEELDRADEAAENEVDEEHPSPARQRQKLRAHVKLGHPPVGESVARCELVDAAEELSGE